MTNNNRPGASRMIRWRLAGCNSYSLPSPIQLPTPSNPWGLGGLLITLSNAKWS